MTSARISAQLRPALPAFFAAAAATLLFSLPAAAAGGTGSVVWSAATRPDHFHAIVNAGAHVTLRLRASATIPGANVSIVTTHALPRGAELTTTSGRSATARIDWVPRVGGDYRIGFGASAGRVSAPSRTYTIHVVPKPYAITTDDLAHWATVLKPVVARAAPSPTARAITRVETTTSDKTQNIVRALDEIDLDASRTWYRVRLPILPNNSTGWVPASALGQLYTVTTHLYVDRATFRATLMDGGRQVFTTIVGVGKPFWPTPRGEFYVRDKLTNFGNPFYGPVAFGTSARSAVLTDWPGGGFVGIHGTSEPEILPGRVSHGCIRMPNASILKLEKLMPVGTPVTIR